MEALFFFDDGTEKWNQDAHVAVLELPIEAQDLQQCADSIMRIYAEYFLASGQQDRISFHFTNGFEAEYNKCEKVSESRSWRCVFKLMGDQMIYEEYIPLAEY